MGNCAKSKQGNQGHDRKIKTEEDHANGNDGHEGMDDLVDDGDFRDEYEMGDVLGAGTYGTVHACTNKKGKQFAVKLMEHESEEAEGVIWDAFVQESKILKQMDHDNVVRIYDVYVDTSFTYVVMDKLACDLMSAVKVLLEAGKPMGRAMLVSTFKQMITSIQYIHSKKIIHRDVKADNYLVDTTDLSGEFRVVLTDFGTACELDYGTCLTEQLGTKRYWAPELVTMEYSHPVDVWAVGITLFGCSTGSFPFKNEDEIISKKITIPKTVKNTLGDLLLRILDKDPRKRLKPDQCMSHIWVVQTEESSKKKKNQKGIGKEKTSAKAAMEAEEEKQKAEEEAAEKEEEMALSNFLMEAREKMEVPADVAKRRQKALEEINKKYQQGIKTSLKVGTGKKLARRGSSVDAAGADEVDGFETGAAIGGEKRCWEWWPPKKCLENGIELNNDFKRSGTGNLGGLQMVKLEWTRKGIEDLLRKYEVNIEAFGKGDAKTLAAIEKEILSGESYLAEGQGRLTRVVDIIVMRVVSPQGKFLVETKQTFPDGRVRERNLLPGAMKRPTEDQMSTVRRILVHELKVKYDTVKFVGGKFAEVLEEEKESPSYPGLKSVYRKCFIEGFVEEASAEDDLKKLGAPDFKSFGASMADGTNETYEWWSEEQCKQKGVALRGNTMDGGVPGGRVQLLPWNDKLLTETLQDHRVDIKKFGTGKARSISEFARELSTGECQLVEGEDGKLLRLVDLIVLSVKKNDNVLVEAYHLMGNRKRERKVLPGTKRRHDEDVLQASRRLMGEIKIPYNLADMSIGRRVFEEKESPSYPEITTVYAKQHVEANLLGQVNAAVNRRLSMPMNFGSKSQEFLSGGGATLTRGNSGRRLSGLEQGQVIVTLSKEAEALQIQQSLDRLENQGVAGKNSSGLGGTKAKAKAAPSGKKELDKE